jgi:hypothetical protein
MPDARAATMDRSDKNKVFRLPFIVVDRLSFRRLF